MGTLGGTTSMILWFWTNLHCWLRTSMSLSTSLMSREGFFPERISELEVCTTMGFVIGRRGGWWGRSIGSL